MALKTCQPNKLFKSPVWYYYFFLLLHPQNTDIVDLHDITEILLKVALTGIKQANKLTLSSRFVTHMYISVNEFLTGCILNTFRINLSLILLIVITSDYLLLPPIFSMIM